MPKYMLSFNNGRKIAVALDKDKNVIFTIYVTEEKELPDIQCDDVLALIDDADITKLKQSLKIGNIDEKVLKRILKDRNKKGGFKMEGGKIDIESVKASDKIRRAVQILEDKANEKLKTEIDFTDVKEVKNVVPLIGQGKDAFDRSIFLCAPSGAGKTWMIKLIIEQDLQKRPVVLFSKIVDDDSLKSLEGLKTPKDKKDRLIKIPLLCEDDLLDLPPEDDLKETICVFDDLDSFHSDIAQYIRQYRDSILESGRHKNITCICTSHLLNNYTKTKTMLNEAEIVILFPNSNRRHSSMFLQNILGIEKIDRDFLIEKASRAGRFLALKMSSPNMLIHNKGIMLI